MVTFTAWPEFWQGLAQVAISFAVGGTLVLGLVAFFVWIFGRL